jgi:hypothetical protein
MIFGNFGFFVEICKYICILINFTFSVYINKLQFYYLLSVLFCWLCSSLTFFSVYNIVKVTLQLTVRQSLCPGIEPILGLVTRYYFLSEGCFLKFAVLSLWPERSGLSFVFLSAKMLHNP